jgi:beta-lactamase class A
VQDSRINGLAIAVAALLGCLATAVFAAQSEPLPVAQESPAKAQVEQLIKASGADVAIAFQTLDGSQQLYINPDEVFHAASTMKLPIMIELFAQIHAGKLSLDDKLPVTNQFKSFVDGSPYSLEASDDSDDDVYKAIGAEWTIRQLCEHMITKSSNLAADILMENVGVENIRARVHALGADGMNVLRPVEDLKAFQAGMNNTTTARGLFILLKAIYENRAGDPDSCRQMLEILKRQTINDAIPAGLRPGIAIAHKTGDITGQHHDAAIVYAPEPFILVVMTRGLADYKASGKLIADITRAIYAGSR